MALDGCKLHMWLEITCTVVTLELWVTLDDLGGSGVWWKKRRIHNVNSYLGARACEYKFVFLKGYRDVVNNWPWRDEFTHWSPVFRFMLWLGLWRWISIPRPFQGYLNRVAVFYLGILIWVVKLPTINLRPNWNRQQHSSSSRHGFEATKRVERMG